MTFDDLKFRPHQLGSGCHAVVSFPNGYGASVVSGGQFYTSDAEPYELAVLKNGHLCYDTPITNDVIGYQTADDITVLLQRIEALPASESTQS